MRLGKASPFVNRKALRAYSEEESAGRTGRQVTFETVARAHAVAGDEPRLPGRIC